MHEWVYPVLITNLSYHLVAYFHLGLQKVLVQFFMVGTHVFSHMCIFLECHRKNKITSRVQHLTLIINSKSSKYYINDIMKVIFPKS